MYPYRSSTSDKEPSYVSIDEKSNSYWDRICKIEFDTEDEPLIEVIDGEEWIRVRFMFYLNGGTGEDGHTNWVRGVNVIPVLKKCLIPIKKTKKCRRHIR